MKHSCVLGLVVVLTVWSLRNVTARAYAVGTSRHKSDHRMHQVFRGGEKKLVFKTARAVLPKATTEKKGTLNSVIGVMVGLSLLGAVPASAQATVLSNMKDYISSRGAGGASVQMPKDAPKDAPILNKVFGNIGSQAVAATVLKAKPDPNPAAPFQDRNPHAFLDSDRNNYNKDDMNDRKRANQRPGKRVPLLDNDFREAYATFFHDSN